VPATDRATTLGELVAEQPAAAELFERLGLDYCCGGRRTLEQACAQRGVDAATVAVLLETLSYRPSGAEAQTHDVTRATIAELCDHIAASHHEPLRRDLGRIAELLDTVVRVHGGDHPELHDLRRLFASTRAELEQHMEVEEQALFPACRALGDEPATAQPAPDAGLLALLEDDHAATGAALTALRELAGGYDAERALCGTHRALLQALHAFERDMHLHVHEENNVLFPRVRARIGAT
jgi:regulator of cell morphogenesis and NO signaling